jgi:flagellum-specific peptidoglycan hydrolase FlgJ
MNLKRYSHKVVISLLLSSSLSAKTPSFKNNYLTRFEAIAIKEMRRSGVPASITLAQGILESGWGRSPLAKTTNNHFGIKCHADWEGQKHRTLRETKAEIMKTTCYRAYDNAEESYKDHTDFLLKNALYEPLFEQKDYRSWAVGLEALGYAKDDAYAELLVSIIECNELYRYDIMLESPYSAEELSKMSSLELFSLLRFGLFGAETLPSSGIIDIEWATLNKDEERWFDMGLQPLTYEQRRKKPKDDTTILCDLWL